MQSGLLLDVVVREGAPVFQLFPGKEQALLVGRNALLVLDLLLHSLHRVGALDVQRHRFAWNHAHKERGRERQTDRHTNSQPETEAIQIKLTESWGNLLSLTGKSLDEDLAAAATASLLLVLLHERPCTPRVLALLRDHVLALLRDRTGPSDRSVSLQLCVQLLQQLQFAGHQRNADVVPVLVAGVLNRSLSTQNKTRFRDPK